MSIQSYITTQHSLFERHIAEANEEDDMRAVAELRADLAHLTDKAAIKALEWARDNLADETFKNVWSIAAKKRNSLYNSNAFKQSRKFRFWDSLLAFCGQASNSVTNRSCKFAELF